MLIESCENCGDILCDNASIRSCSCNPEPPRVWNHQQSKQFGSSATYRLAGQLLEEHQVKQLEDWGCGCCAMKKFFSGERYLGVDATPGFAEIIESLVTRRTACEAILLRHVLEHNTAWPAILANAIASAELVLVISFISFKEKTCLALGRTQPTFHLSWPLFEEVVGNRFLKSEKIEHEVVFLIKGDLK